MCPQNASSIFFDSFSTIDRYYFWFYCHGIPKLFSTRGRSQDTSHCPNTDVIQNNLIALYLLHSIPPPTTYTGLQFSTSEFPATGFHFSLFLQIFSASVVLFDVLSTANLFRSQIHPLLSQFRLPEADARRKTNPFCHVTAILYLLILHCTMPLVL